ncbi:MAG TPA: lipid-A-disaccharide synthase [Chroococcidiopsis sp.]
MTKARIFISTGEVSGDLQGSLLVTALWRQAEQMGLDLEILAIGGDRMAQAGATMLGNTSSIGSIGIFESLPYVLPIVRMQRRANRYLADHMPDVVVMIDYGSPNLRLGTYIRKHLPQMPTVYYIAPQEWVWSLSSRVTQQVVKVSDRLLAVFAEEARYYAHWGGNTTYVGHPLIDRMQAAPSRAQARDALGIAPDDVAIALVPASRHQELKYLVPVMFQAARQIQAKLPQARFWVPLSLPEFRPALEASIRQYGLRATLVNPAESRQVLAAADLAIAKSGTVNLELTLQNVPQVVMYRVNPVTAWIAEHILRFSIPFMSPTNLAVMEPVVPEFLQYHATADSISQASLELLLNPQRRQRMLDDYQRVRQALGEPGVCDRAAQEILKMLPARVLQPA